MLQITSLNLNLEEEDWDHVEPNLKSYPTEENYSQLRPITPTNISLNMINIVENQRAHYSTRIYQI